MILVKSFIYIIMTNRSIFFIFRFFIPLLLLMTSNHIWGQESIEKVFYEQYNAACSDVEKIKRPGQLADYFYANNDFEKGDSQIEKQIMLAEATMQPALMLQTCFRNAGYYSAGSATKDHSKNTRTYLNRALAYAKATDHIDFVAMANANLAALNYTDGQINEAFKNANLAFTTSLNTDNDSAKVICAIQLGNIYQLRADILMAFNIFTNAQNIGLHSSK